MSFAVRYLGGPIAPWLRGFRCRGVAILMCFVVGLISDELNPSSLVPGDSAMLLHIATETSNVYQTAHIIPSCPVRLAGWRGG